MPAYALSRVFILRNNQRWFAQRQSLRLPPQEVGDKSGRTKLIQSTITKRRRRRHNKTAHQKHAVDSTNARRATSRQNVYAAETIRPVVCLAFVLPLLLVYEFGSIFTDHFSGKSGIDRWLHQLLDSVGIGHLVILPIVTAGALLFLHHRLADHWKFRPQVLLGMLAESFCLGIILYFAGNAVHEIISSKQLDTLSIGDIGQPNCWTRTIAFIGSGVYEELIFRLLLLTALIHVGKKHLTANTAKIAGTLITSLIFSSMHYDLINPSGYEFEIFSFVYRFLASLLFCLLFLFRGFGIAVGTHCTYDVLTQI